MTVLPLHYAPQVNVSRKVVGSHMLEVCPSIAKEQKPILDAQFLGIGGKADPARLIFSTPIDNDTRIPAFKDALRWNDLYYKLTSR